MEQKLKLETFLLGMGKSIDLGATLLKTKRGNGKKNEFQIDAELLRRDWEMVGEDMQRGCEKFGRTSNK